MPTCQTCAHPSRPAIDYDLAHGFSLRTVAEKYSLSPWSLHRHLHHHATDVDTRLWADVHADIARIQQRMQAEAGRAPYASFAAVQLIADVLMKMADRLATTEEG